MKARAAQSRRGWRWATVYAPLADEADFLKKIPDHARRLPPLCGGQDGLGAFAACAR